MKETRFKYTDIGPIPEDWEVYKLGNLGLFSKGKGISRAEAQTGSIPAIRYGEIYTIHNDYIKSFHSFISESVASRSIPLTMGQILFTCSGETKEDIAKAVAFLGNEKAYVGGDIIVLTPKIECSSQFLGYLCNTANTNKQKAEAAQGDAVVHIASESVKNIIIPLPPFDEQERIAEALSDVDALIAELDKLIAKKRLIKQGAMQQLLTGHTRLPGFSDPWENLTIKNAGYFKSGDFTNPQFISSYQNESLFPCYGGNGLRGYTPFHNYDGVKIVVGRVGALCGNVHLTAGPFQATEHALIFFPSIPINIPWLAYLLSFMELGQYAIGNAQPVLTQSNLSELEISLPSLSEQRAIATILSDLDSEIFFMEQKKSRYQLIKQGMMQQLLTGRIRLI
ncbi:MAG: restriction endonuclease subunit S [Bacteroidales bacterium]|nr:restriction endonuclease subunit S [Bacteroidales bacterium]